MNSIQQTIALGFAIGSLTTLVTPSVAQDFRDTQQFRDLKAQVEGLEIDQMNRQWDEMERQHQRKMEEIHADTDRNLEVARQSQQMRLEALKLTVDQIRGRQPAAKAALLHFINGCMTYQTEMEKPEVVRSAKIVREGLAENADGMKQLRNLPITPLPMEDRTTMLVCYGESKPGNRDREVKSLVNRLWHARWRLEKREFWPLSMKKGDGIWIVRGKIYL